MLRNENRPAPCAEPIDSIEALIDWREDNAENYYMGVAPLEPCQRLDNEPRTLVCHDMAGGYLADKFVQGSDKYDSYRFYHWHLVDTFVYFSHHMITIPPPCWINAAHKHGVPVLGTFITEWDDGAEKCEMLLSDRSLMETVINQLVKIATHHSMDGWLINIENKVDFSLVPDLALFLSLLTERMHAANYSSQVIWYDSVTIEGELKWQNELNNHNGLFFESCDAIFLNYTWSRDNLMHSAEYGKDRLQDIYVGIDVFGRGMIGGGGYNTKEALALARDCSLSIALFAPGWVYEENGSRDFNANEESVFRFWYYLQPYLSMHVSCSLPMASSFCQGWGSKNYIHGQAISDEPWSNLSMQQLQPTLTHKELGYNPHQQHMWLDLQDGFLGGGAMRFVGRLPNNRDALTYRLFDMATDLDTPIYVSYTMKRLPMEEGAQLALYLILNKAEDGTEERILLPEEDSIRFYDEEDDITIQSLSNIPEALKVPAARQEAGRWTHRCFSLPAEMVDQKTLVEIGILAYTNNPEPLTLNVLLGSVQVLSTEEATLHPVSVTNLEPTEVYVENMPDALSVEDADKCVSMKLTWDEPDIAADVAAYHIWYSINEGDNKWLNMTYTNKFYISSLLLDSAEGNIQFSVQVLYKSGILQPIDQSARCTLTF